MCFPPRLHWYSILYRIFPTVTTRTVIPYWWVITRLFHKSFRVEKSRTHTACGCGLGDATHHAIHIYIYSPADVAVRLYLPYPRLHYKIKISRTTEPLFLGRTDRLMTIIILGTVRGAIRYVNQDRSRRPRRRKMGQVTHGRSSTLIAEKILKHVMVMAKREMGTLHRWTSPLVGYHATFSAATQAAHFLSFPLPLVKYAFSLSLWHIHETQTYMIVVSIHFIFTLVGNATMIVPTTTGRRAMLSNLACRISSREEYAGTATEAHIVLDFISRHVKPSFFFLSLSTLPAIAAITMYWLFLRDTILAFASVTG